MHPKQDNASFIMRWFQPSSGLPKGRWLPVGVVGAVLFGTPIWLASLRAGTRIGGPLGVTVFLLGLCLGLLIVSLWSAFCRRRGLASQLPRL